LVGINHIALEVGDVDEALEWYGRIFDLELRGYLGRMAFVDMGDQFIALSQGRTQPPDTHRHFGLVVDDKQAARAALEAAGAEILPGRGLDFLDPWGTTSRSSSTATSSSRRRPRPCAGWAWSCRSRSKRSPS
jgi:lactoylglutathione lyase